LGFGFRMKKLPLINRYGSDQFTLEIYSISGIKQWDLAPNALIKTQSFACYLQVICILLCLLVHHKMAHEQYKWYLPRGCTNGTVKIEDVLVAYSAVQIKEMREEIINMIPKFVYTDPRYNVEGKRDVFDIAIDSVIEKMKGIRDESG
jgi:hypothetical protein